MKNFSNLFTDDGSIKILSKKSHEHYRAIFENLPYIAFTLDRKGRFIECNEYTRKLFKIEIEKVRGKGFYEIGFLQRRDIFKGIREFKKNLSGKVTDKTIYEIKIEGKKFYIELLGIPLMKNGIVTEVFDVGTDVTEQTIAIKEKEKLIGDLKKDLEKKLNGFIPICANCKKIRDKDGLWYEIEDYFKNHHNLEFSHSLCPECLKSLYPDFNRDKK
ncbi:PAS domain-containing protein [candidate division WOR-3 bacterium]|nr:PAS domain-containing protein [candidate division WOR-3 bacterium]